MKRPSPSDFVLNPRPGASLDRVGREGEPVLTVDGLLQSPDRLVDYAVQEVAFAPAFGPDGGYPGLRAPAPLDYVETVVRALQPFLAQAFDLAGMVPVRAECTLSLVTLPPARLVAAQRAPHVDTDSPLQIALLHYLCDERFGGTDFFRHRATGFEAIGSDRLERYEHVRAQEERQFLPAKGYAGEDAQFQRIGGVQARWNRLVAYRSNLLHSGRISRPDLLSPDPRQGRLTANIFLTYARRSA